MVVENSTLVVGDEKCYVLGICVPSSVEERRPFSLVNRSCAVLEEREQEPCDDHRMTETDADALVMPHCGYENDASHRDEGISSSFPVAVGRRDGDSKVLGNHSDSCCDFQCPRRDLRHFWRIDGEQKRELDGRLVDAPRALLVTRHVV